MVVVMPASGMILGCMSIVRGIVGVLSITDRVHNVIVVAGVGCIIGGLAGMVSVVRSMMALRIRTRMVVFMMTMVCAQRHSD